jgi:sigma-B regulation protein RsbU (phosphoserine phosphatase)
VLQLLNHRLGAFSAEDVEFLAELGSPFAIGLTTARLHREIVERERMQEELRLAAEIQRTLQPRDWGQIPGLALESLSRPCREVGGDYHDLIPTDRNGRFWLTVADISGKGVSAGLIASNVQAYLWSRRSDGRPLQRVVAEGSELLYRLTRGRKFATAILAEWNPPARTLSWVNAGHVPLLLRRGDTVTAIEATGRPMGLLPGEHYSCARRELLPGDLFLVCTDGVLEAGISGPQGELGLERLDACLRRASSAATAVAEVDEELRRHLGDEAPDDDVTVLCGECL